MLLNVVEPNRVGLETICGHCLLGSVISSLTFRDRRPPPIRRGRAGASDVLALPLFNSRYGCQAAPAANPAAIPLVVRHRMTTCHLMYAGSELIWSELDPQTNSRQGNRQ
jgi:hypothetical protein